MPNQKETILGALVTDELQRVNKSLSLWKKNIRLPADTLWKDKNSLTLDEFLTIHPAPSDPKNMNELLIYGIAWELTWGKQPPKIIAEKREELLVKARYCVGEVGELEQIWLNLIAADAEFF